MTQQWPLAPADEASEHQPCGDEPDAAGVRRPCLAALNAPASPRRAIKEMIEASTDLSFAGFTSDARDALAAVGRCKAHAAIVGIDLADTTGFALLRDIRMRHHGVRTIVYAPYDAPGYIDRCFRLGARGYVAEREPLENLLQAVREALKGKLYLHPDRYGPFVSNLLDGRPPVGEPPLDLLTDREFEVFHLAGEGRPVWIIAAILGCAVKTVQACQRGIEAKLGGGARPAPRSNHLGCGEEAA